MRKLVILATNSVVLQFNSSSPGQSVSSSSTNAQQQRQMGLQSPAKRFASIRARCLEATAILFGGLNSVRAARLPIGNLECLTEKGLLKPNHFVKHHSFILWCLNEAFDILNVHDLTEANYFRSIVQSVVSMAKLVMENVEVVNKEEYKPAFASAIGTFFLTIESMLSVVDRSEDGFNVALIILQEMRRIPCRTIASMSGK